MDKEVIIIIPARLASERLPNKPLLEVMGRPIIEHVLLACGDYLCHNFGNVFISTPDKELEKELNPCWRDSLVVLPCEAKNGTERVYHTVNYLFDEEERQKYIFVNVQCDQVALDPRVIDYAVEEIKKGAQVASVCSNVITEKEMTTLSRVKVYLEKVRSEEYDAKAWTRFSPFDNPPVSGVDGPFLHFGIYAYTYEALWRYCHQYEPKTNEIVFHMEQLRWEEPIAMAITSLRPTNIDTLADYERVKNRI